MGKEVLLSGLVCGLLSVVLAGHQDISVQSERATTPHHVVELLMVSDYSLYKRFYDNTSSSDSSHVRQQQAVTEIKKYMGALIHSTNKVYESMQSRGIYITIKVVDIIVMKTAQDSPWTETVKVAATPLYEVEPRKVFPLFQPKSESLQATIPHDHAMLLTTYALYEEGSSGDTFSGYANIEAECKARSISLVQDNQDFYTAQLMAHELGHSLGCEHDGDGNSCPSGAGYAMETHFILANQRKWTFSNCSVDYIRSYLSQLNSKGHNCLLHTQNHHPSPEMALYTGRLYGQVYTADQQCQINYGSQSYLCRDHYHSEDFSTLCLKLKCFKPGTDSCNYIDGGDGTPCGDGKWCVSDQCVADSRALHVPEHCPVGDQPGVVKDGLTCSQLVQHDPGACSHQTIKHKCCVTCVKTAGTSSVTVSHISIDDQCAKKHGTGSHLCRGAGHYDNLAYSDIVCRDMQCKDPNRSHWCLSSVADDGTPCGNKKWCQNSQCVHDNNAPAVSDTCPWGDIPGVATHSLTCAQLKQPEYHWRCYDDYTSKVCCSACGSFHRNTANCEYGDKSDWCLSNIRSQHDRRSCYYGHNADLCCESCSKYANTALVGCEYGDKVSGCVASRCSHYHSQHRADCCSTCRAGGIIG